MHAMHAVVEALTGLLCVGACALLALGVVLLGVWNARGKKIARGIVLQVNSQPAAKGGIGTSRYEVRGVWMDVEIDGRPPFEVRSTAYIPVRFVPDVLPGATVAIQIHPRRPGTLWVIGPGMAVPAFAIAGPPLDRRP